MVKACYVWLTKFGLRKLALQHLRIYQQFKKVKRYFPKKFRKRSGFNTKNVFSAKKAVYLHKNSHF